MNDEKSAVTEKPTTKKKAAKTIPVAKLEKMLSQAQKELSEIQILSLADQHNSAMLTERVLVLQEILGIIPGDST